MLASLFYKLPRRCHGKLASRAVGATLLCRRVVVGNREPFAQFIVYFGASLSRVRRFPHSAVASLVVGTLLIGRDGRDSPPRASCCQVLLLVRSLGFWLEVWTGVVERRGGAQLAIAVSGSMSVNSLRGAWCGHRLG